jgi:hypothetical protein
MQFLAVHRISWVFLCVAFLFSIHAAGSSPGSMSAKTLAGDKNPPPYSALNIELDTVAGPVTIQKSVIGFINQLEGT